MWVRMHPQRAPVLEEGGRAELRQKMKVAFCRSFVSPPAGAARRRPRGRWSVCSGNSTGGWSADSHATPCHLNFITDFVLGPQKCQNFLRAAQPWWAARSARKRAEPARKRAGAGGPTHDSAHERAGHDMPRFLLDSFFSPFS